MKPKAHIALLRGINVSGHNKIPMAELRDTAAQLGWRDIQTYIQSGNLLFKADSEPANLETALEHAIQKRFGLSIPVVVRDGVDWSNYTRSNPFAAACESEPNLVMLALSKARPNPSAAAELQDRAAHGERVVHVGDAIWIHYAGGVAKSKLSPALIDRLVGSAVTARNWRTVLKLEEMVGGL